MSNEPPECQLMAQVATSSLLRTVLLLTVLCCFLCVPSCVYSLWRIQRSVKMHFNSKCIFFTHNFSMLVHCTVRIVLHGKDLLNYFGSWHDGCELLPSRARCELRTVYKLSQYICEVSPFILTAERFVATFRAHRYENRFKWCGMFLIGAHITFPLVMVIIQSHVSSSGGVIVYYCWLASVDSAYMMNVPIVIIVISQMATIPGTLYLLRKNERIRETSLLHCASLTQRYQIFENLRTLSMFRIMSIVTWLYVTYNGAASFTMHFYLAYLPLPTQFALIEVIHCLPFYFLILTYLILREDKKPQHQFEIKVNNYHPHYFDELQKFFDEAFEKIHSRKRVGPMQKVKF